ncbi:type III-A CRISPR-associated protein Csm2 [Ileibacterium valens]|uniref:type III-A CRISPR-associated protein Csm2 n=1 Tax=Ileibacterium valens TaxID=1862668 RepID=UPI00257368E7|nr:type III-A CRISPR-associated protein Csm2 [Ileibacterium valens]
MAYNNNYNKTNYNNADRSNRNNGWDKPKFQFDSAARITQPLSIYYANKTDVYLPENKLYLLAQSISKLTNSQIRKVLDLTKESLSIIRYSEADFEKAKVRLFTLLPMTAYNAGRASKGDRQSFEKLLEFIYENVNPESIQCAADIQVFDQLITTVVAYHKFLGGK